ncbi:WD40-repeat-containing domain protein [Trichoderma austrokoningii]
MYNLRFPGFPTEQISPPSPDPLAPITYSCIYWVDHFNDSECLQPLGPGESSQSEDAITKFFELKYLYWLEALSLLRGMSNGLLAVEKLKENVEMSQLAQFLEDAYRFLLSNKQAIESAPLQSYATALVFGPSQSRVRGLFTAEEPEWILVKPHVKEHYTASLSVLEGHTMNINAAAFSHDSSLIASGSDDKTVRVWRTSTGDCIQEVQGHSDCIVSVAFSGDAELLASGSADGTVRLWRPGTGDCLHIFNHTSSLNSVAFSFDSLFIASASGHNNTIRIWHADSGNCVREIHSRCIVAVTFSRDSLLFASASVNGVIQLWHVETGDCVREMRTHACNVSSATFSYDLVLVAFISDRYNIHLWRIDTGEPVRRIHSIDSVKFTAFSDNSRLIASVGVRGIIRIWSVDTGDCMRILNTDEESDRCGAFSRDIRLIAVQCMEKMMSLWPTHVDSIVPEVYPDSATQKGETDGNIQERKIIKALVTLIVFSPNLALIASASFQDDVISLWCAETGEWIRDLRGYSNGIYSAIFSHDSLLLVSASRDKIVRIWRVNTGECVHELRHGAGVSAVAISHDSGLVATASLYEIKLWRTDTGSYVQDLEMIPVDMRITMPDNDVKKRHRLSTLPGIASVAFSHNSALVAAATLERVVQILNVATGDHVQTLPCSGNVVTAICFLRDSALVATAADDGTVRLWRVDTGEYVQEIYVGAVLTNLSFTMIIHKSLRILALSPLITAV